MTRLALRQLDFVSDPLKDMVEFIEKLWGVECTITSLYRIGDKGVHGQLPLRGIDVRCEDPQLGRETARQLNLRWTYDSERPEMVCCIFHDVGQGEHIHLQCHPRTVRNGAS